MTRLAYVLASLAPLVACGGSSGATSPDGTPSGGPTTLATVTTGRIAIAGDCIVVAAGSTVTCVPSAGGAPRTLATVTGMALVPMAAGSDLVVSSVPGDFGPADAQLELDRIAPDGTLTKLIATAAGAGGGEGLALAGSDVVFTTGGDADLDAIPLGGGSASVLSFDSGNFGDLALVGTTAYYVNAPEIHSHDMSAPGTTDPGGDPIAGGADFEAPSLASDGTTLVAAGTSIEGTQTTVLAIPAGPAIAPLAAPGGRLAAIAGTAYVIAGADLVAIDLATGVETTAVAGEQPFDVAVSADRLVWITQAGEVRTQSR